MSRGLGDVYKRQLSLSLSLSPSVSGDRFPESLSAAQPKASPLVLCVVGDTGLVCGADTSCMVGGRDRWNLQPLFVEVYRHVLCCRRRRCCCCCGDESSVLTDQRRRCQD